MIGTFLQQPTDGYEHLRTALLRSGGRLPAVDVPGPDPAEPGDLADRLARQLKHDGVGRVRLTRPLDDDTFRALGTTLGALIPETDPAVRDFVTGDVILNLISAQAETHDPALQPFAAGALTMHSEGSGRPAAEQPRYIVLMCCEPGSDEGAQTVLTPMAAVAAALTPDARRILAATRYRDAPGVPFILREIDDRPVFSFRDFGSAALHWECLDSSVTAAEVHDALRSLLDALYAADLAAGVKWETGTLVVIDNTYFFHGRTAGASSRPGSRRHLKRLRVRTR
ncbi:TauD/TfdA family dioxygenase [Winogradskya humida]|uniref:TauD/TfdA-like domain-containing protein n=1 Tax=Winogradskya humida TaxID=113566 RepID=A0ABQ4A109_9ACTN|nr:TauD/TfdA family dioxygenase [Actinoplanes humidus]GIE24546.1 hypothetical protein Ahu01nite_076480 [Actinoplanes humidus]